jgi:uncharacterized protein involved in exopolysaccharide biosynthesis
MSGGDISISYILKAVEYSKWIIAITFVCIMIISVLVVMQLPNIYKANVLLMPNTDSNGLAIPGQLGNLAALAGVDVGAGGNEKTVLALEILKSRKFLIEFIDSENIKPHIIAATNWNHKTRELRYDKELFDPATSKWIRDVSYPKLIIPSNLESAEAFSELFIVSEDKTNGMVKLSIQHYSPDLAKDWLEKIVYKINENMRLLDAQESETAITFLNNELEKSNNTEIRSMLFSLIEEQTKTLMLTKVKTDYAFSVVDPAIVPEIKFKPQRAIILIMVGAVSIIFLVGFSILRLQLNKGSNK